MPCFRLNETTKGASLKSNLALIENNAKVGADIALELAKISSESYHHGHNHHHHQGELPRPSFDFNASDLGRAQNWPMLIKSVVHLVFSLFKLPLCLG